MRGTSATIPSRCRGFSMPSELAVSVRLGGAGEQLLQVGQHALLQLAAAQHPPGDEQREQRQRQDREQQVVGDHRRQAGEVVVVGLAVEAPDVMNARRHTRGAFQVEGSSKAVRWAPATKGGCMGDEETIDDVVVGDGYAVSNIDRSATATGSGRSGSRWGDGVRDQRDRPPGRDRDRLPLPRPAGGDLLRAPRAGSRSSSATAPTHARPGRRRAGRRRHGPQGQERIRRGRCVRDRGRQGRLRGARRPPPRG